MGSCKEPEAEEEISEFEIVDGHELSATETAFDYPCLVTSRELDNSDIEILAHKRRRKTKPARTLTAILEDEMEDSLEDALNRQKSRIYTELEQSAVAESCQAAAQDIIETSQYIRSPFALIRIPGQAQAKPEDSLMAGAYMFAVSYVLKDRDLNTLSMEVLQFLPQVVFDIEETIKRYRSEGKRPPIRNTLAHMVGNKHTVNSDLFLTRLMAEWLYVRKLSELKGISHLSMRRYYNERLAPCTPVLATAKVIYAPCLAYCATMVAQRRVEMDVSGIDIKSTAIMNKGSGNESDIQ